MASPEPRDPWEVTEEYCQSFLAAFDIDNNGSLSCEEFCEFMKFLYVMVTLKR